MLDNKDAHRRIGIAAGRGSKIRRSDCYAMRAACSVRRKASSVKRKNSGIDIGRDLYIIILKISRLVC